MGKPLSPCKDCEKRQMRCHSNCIEYATFCDETTVYREKVYANKKKQYEAETVSVARSDRANKVIRRCK